MAVGYNSSQLAAFDAVLRNLKSPGNVDLAADVLDLQAQITSITGALGGPDSYAENAPHSGLNFKYKAGLINVFTGAPIATAAGQVTLPDNTATNYIEVDAAGTVSANASAFTTGRIALFTCTTSGGAISNVVSKRPFMSLITALSVATSALQDAAVTGVKLATAGECLTFGRQNVAATESGQLYTSHGVIGYVQDRAGYLIGHSMQCSTARTSGSISIQPTINGSALGQAGLDITVDGTTPQYPYKTVNYAAHSAYAFNPGDRLGSSFSSNTLAPAGTMNLAGMLRVRRS